MRRSFEFAGSYYRSTPEMSRASNGDPGPTETRERINELELGLSLGGGVRRIITAEDFTSMKSGDSPMSSNSSVSSSSSGLGDEGDEGDGGGSCRRADEIGCNGDRSANLASHGQVVGWPPVRTCRRNNLVNVSRVANSYVKPSTHGEISQSCSSNDGKNDVGGSDRKRKAIPIWKSHFVKVTMDGDPIGRKVDLRAYVSYEDLALALEAMFCKPGLSLNVSRFRKSALSLNASRNGMFSKLLDGSSEFALIYEDEDGDWLLVGDVPWGMFLRTARRLRIMKTMDSFGIDESVKCRAQAISTDAL
ncbi:auxin-responsive protein IAA11-like [Phalaenopsis equestris]|uniref:auxin-responsive protein IAA11-like n=1 Tax=Phalaenopsis equestris TaxID=78828 RepID=UPI0009E63084|nr:auxin-responsive protein IAA11-like [Phalaenopsis equestris]